MSLLRRLIRTGNLWCSFIPVALSPILGVPSSCTIPSSCTMKKKTLWLKTHFLVLMIFGVWQNTPRVVGFQLKCPNRLHIFPSFAAHGARWRTTTRAGNVYMVLLYIKKRKSVEAISKSVDAFQSCSSLKTENIFLFWYVTWFCIQNLGGPPCFECLL